MKHLQRRLLDLKIKMKANLDRFLISGHLRLIAVLTGRVFFFHPWRVHSFEIHYFLSSNSFSFIPVSSQQSRWAGWSQTSPPPLTAAPRLRLSYSLFHKSISSKIGLSSSVMKHLVYPPADQSNLWLPASQTSATSREKDSSFSWEILFIPLRFQKLLEKG